MNDIFIIFALILILVLIAIISLFITFNNKKNSLIKENLEAALQNQKRQHELELKALRGQMNPHFVHNSLNAIQYYIQQNDVETSEDYLAKFSKLMRQFFDFSRRKTVSVKDEISLLKNYLYIEKLRFEEKLEYLIEVDQKLDTDEEQIPSMILQPLVENAINHGLFHKKGKGTLTIKFIKINENTFKVLIIDNGIGINKAKGISTAILNKKESHSSAVLEERLHFLNQSSNFMITHSIVDLSTENVKETGTRVELQFNYNQDEQD